MVHDERGRRGKTKSDFAYHGGKDGAKAILYDNGGLGVKIDFLFYKVWQLCFLNFLRSILSLNSYPLIVFFFY